MATEAAAGSQTATISTEHTLNTATTAGVYVLKVDMTNLASGDEVTLRAKVRGREAEATRRIVFQGSYAHALGIPIAQSIPVVGTSVEFTLQQTAGTGRAFPWSVWSI
jgi:hypothetical protein